MTLQEAAAVLHIDLESAVVRLGGNERLYRRYHLDEEEAATVEATIRPFDGGDA